MSVVYPTDEQVAELRTRLTADARARAGHTEHAHTPTYTGVTWSPFDGPVCTVCGRDIRLDGAAWVLERWER